jgi:RNA polymerase sigma-70 factor (ECF subfamily)
MLAPDSREQWTQLRADVGRLVARRLPAGADAEDVVQEVLLRVWRHSDSLNDEERFGAWLARIARTATADHLRSRQRHPLPRFVGGESTDEDAPSKEEPSAKDLVATALRPFIVGLAEPYREALLLAELEELPYPILAKRLGISVSGVKSRVQRGRVLLREALERCCAIALDVRGTPLTCEIKVGGKVPPGCCPGVGPACGNTRPRPPTRMPRSARSG